MNCPVPSDPLPDEGHNQNPPTFAPELMTNNSLNHRANDTRAGNGSQIDLTDGSHASIDPNEQEPTPGDNSDMRLKEETIQVKEVPPRVESNDGSRATTAPACCRNAIAATAFKIRATLVKYAKFVGPGIMISVAYIDPGNYATDVSAGASYRFKLLFMVFLSNIIAVFLQSLCAKLGTVTGLNLAENCRKHLPRWLNYVLYFFAEAAIIATDISEVIGTVIALNLLLHVPLVAGCAIAITDVLFILLFYNPSGMTLRATRIFEMLIALLVIGVVVCFCVELRSVHGTSIGEVFKGYLPSSALLQPTGLYQSCGILGATVMPHSLYLGSDLVKPRLRDYDLHHSSTQNSLVSESAGDGGPSQSSGSSQTADDEAKLYRPSLYAVRSCLSFSIWEIAISLFTFALFVNSAILIVAGASLSDLPDSATNKADLFSIHSLLSSTLAPAAGTIFALALLLSGTSAGIVCTMAGQIVSEGQLKWRVKPWIRRLVTRGISIIPSVVVAGAIGRAGLSTALGATQVALSVVLPITMAPLIWFTCKASIMRVWTDEKEEEQCGTKAGTGGNGASNSEKDKSGNGVDEAQRAENGGGRFVVMRNHWLTAVFAIIVWLVIVVMNVALIVLAAMGKG